MRYPQIAKLINERGERAFNELTDENMIRTGLLAFGLLFHDDDTLASIEQVLGELSTLNPSDIVETYNNGIDDDFEIEVDEPYNLRLIDADVIDEIMRDELESDKYVLGCTQAWFIANVLDIDRDVIEAMQEVGAYSAIGKLIISMGKLEEYQQDMVRHDGYGYHFSPHDGSEDTIAIDGKGYYVFHV